MEDLVPPETEDVPAWQRQLEQPQSNLICVSAWILASAIFIGAIALFGGPSQVDSAESSYATWAIAHGNFACAYPSVTAHNANFFLFYIPGPSVPPVWPLLSGGAAALTRIGHTAAFPSHQAMGVNCGHAYIAMYNWAQNTAALFPTIGLGYLSWFFLLAGVIAFLRATGRGRSGWEVVGVLLVALVPIVWQPLLQQYHPQDLVALGLALIGAACAIRRRWVWAGIALGLAVSTQQFALLVLAPLFVITPWREKWKLIGSSAAACRARSRCRSSLHLREGHFIQCSSVPATRRPSEGLFCGSRACGGAFLLLSLARCRLSSAWPWPGGHTGVSVRRSGNPSLLCLCWQPR